jgi:hypothetical protein
MATFFFHCEATQGVLVDKRGSELDDICEARARAFAIIQGLIASEGAEDCRGWSLRVSDDDGEELFAVPFSSVVGRLH